MALDLFLVLLRALSDDLVFVSVVFFLEDDDEGGAFFEGEVAFGLALALAAALEEDALVTAFDAFDAFDTLGAGAGGELLEGSLLLGLALGAFFIPKKLRMSI